MSGAAIIICPQQLKGLFGLTGFATKTDVISVLHTFSKNRDEAFTSHFSEASLLGQGGYGRVYRGVLPNGEDVAVKRLDVGSRQGDREFLNEVEKISQVHHKHLMSLVGYCTEGSERILVYEYVPNGSLDLHLHGEGRPTLDWAARLKAAVGSAKGLAYLHEDCHPKILHRDVKAANILLNSECEGKIADFGFAKFFSGSNPRMSRLVGTFGYIPPESILSGEQTEKSDTFSFGIVLLELITGRRPVGSTDHSVNDILVNSVSHAILMFPIIAQATLLWDSEFDVYSHRSRNIEIESLLWSLQARPQLTRALEDGNFDSLVDPMLQNNYNPSEMARMVACAAACVRELAQCRPKMSLIVRVLEGHQSAADLDDGTGAGPSNLDLEDGNSNYREPTGGYVLPCPSGSSSGGPSCQTAGDVEMGRM
ncbi:hypothetical protein EUGRSUZ_C03357 [Eucalyptus grandis]|uniref:Uncharacterized protein n=1 Tax=Eucalyptus grandis TaxID=71139 RepID=A0ACC3LK59_EUCGR|nr:hypothetical protein EUGRSUZ_C03357 [Eucalyptus grandis]